MRRINLILEVALLFRIVEIASGQTAPNVHQSATRSPCSNIVALSGAKIDCSNLTTAQNKALESIPAILKMAVENQDYLNAIMTKLQEMTAPSFGNLGPRAMDLSNEIMQDLYFRGWKSEEIESKLITQDEKQRWVQSFSDGFRFSYLDKVLAIRNEFAQFHLLDPQLDEFFEEHGTIEQINKQITAVTPGRENQVLIFPQEIEDVAKRLKVLAKQIPVERNAPRSLPFSISSVRPDNSGAYEMVITINTNIDIVSGYVAVEFNEPSNFMGADSVGGQVILSNEDTIGNKPLQDYLLAHRNNAWVLEIGSTPITPSKPLHIVAEGSQSLSVNEVTFFEK